MTLELRLNGQDIAPLLVGSPRISDHADAVCRTLDFTVAAADGLDNYLGQQLELWAGGTRWFFGFMFLRGREAQGRVTYKAYDPLYYLKKNPDDYYFNGVTATQLTRRVLENVGVLRGSLANTSAVLKPALYQGAEGDKVILDALARTARINGRVFGLRFNPETAAADLYEKTVPAELWAFQRGINLLDARYEESIEDHYNIVKLVNRETGKTVTRINQDYINRFGPMTRFEEVGKDEAATMETEARRMLEEGAIVKTSINLEGVNAGLAMPQLYSGDFIYVEEGVTRVLGAYVIKAVEQSFLSADTVQLALDVEKEPSIPQVQYSDAEDLQRGKKKDPSAEGKGVSENAEYSDELKKIMDKYGLA